MTQQEENLIFAKIVRYIAEQIEEDLPDDPWADDDEAAETEDDPSAMAEIQTSLLEVADAFEQAGGFRFAADQAGVLSQVFAVLEAGMRTLALQAAEAGQHNAAAKMEWAAGQARDMTAYLADKQAAGDDGELVLILDEEEEDAW